MTNLKQRARELLHSEALRGRVPEEVQQFLRDFVALEPVAAIGPLGLDNLSRLSDAFVFPAAFKIKGDSLLYQIGADHDPA